MLICRGFTEAARRKVKVPDKFKDILEPYDRLVKITILGKKFEVPENNSLLRCFQFLSLDSISRGDFCWNRDCLNCQVWIDNKGKEKGLIACRAKVEEGMSIIRLHKEVDLRPIGVDPEKSKENPGLGKSAA